MGLAARFERLVPDLSATLLRFPVPAALSVALCIYSNLFAISNGEQGFNVATGAAAAFIAAGGAHLFAEGRKLPKLFGIMLALAAAAAAAGLGFFTKVFSTNLLFLFAGLMPVLMIAPYLRSGAGQEALWLFNLRLGLAVLLAAIIGLLFGAGLSAIVEALNLLFGVGLYGQLHEHIWLTAMALVAPLYGLSLVPRDLEEGIVIETQRGTLLERGVSVLINYVAVPVIAIYALILHAYGIKIILDGELPHGQVATMVSIFAIGGTATWLVAWPWREQGTRLLRLFMRFWFFLLVAPAVLLAVAIQRRLADYGVTPDRYGIILVAVWVAALVFYLAIRRNRADMRAILGAAALLLLVGAVGPMGANGLTVSSQFTRLVALLENHGILADGKLAKDSKRLDATTASAGYSMLIALKDAGGLGRLRPWFADDAKNPFIGNGEDWALIGMLSERLGFSMSTPDADYVNFTANRPATIAMPQGASLIGPLQATQRYDTKTPQPPMSAMFDATVLTIILENRRIDYPLADLLKQVKARLSADQSVQPSITFDLSPGVTIAIDQFYANGNSTPQLGNMRFWLILRPAP